LDDDSGRSGKKDEGILACKARAREPMKKASSGIEPGSDRQRTEVIFEEKISGKDAFDEISRPEEFTEIELEPVELLQG
jgi:hypothetical protein